MFFPINILARNKQRLLVTFNTLRVQNLDGAANKSAIYVKKNVPAVADKGPFAV